MTGQEPPKVFINHASEDKERFVFEFARRLREKGVDAWLDRWEMSGGDSLVERIFTEGIGEAQAFIPIISRFSVDKPWVKEELSAGVVKRINEATRLIPIVLDDVPAPVAVEHLLRYDVPKQGIDHVVDEVVRTVFGGSIKPPLGLPPTYLTGSHGAGMLSDPADDVVLAVFLDQMRENTRMTQWNSALVEEKVLAAGINKAAYDESLAALIDEGILHGGFKVINGAFWNLAVADDTWLEHEKQRGVDLGALRRRVLSAVVNEGTTGDWAAFSDVHWRTLDILFNRMSNDGLFDLQHTQGGPYISNVSPLAARALRQMG